MGGSLPVCCRHWRGFSARSPAPTTARPHPHPPPPPSIFTPRSPSSTFRPHPHYEPARNDPPPSPPPTYPHASLPHPPSTFLTATPSTLHPPPSKGTCLGNELLARESAREGVASRVDMSTYINAVLRSAAWPSRHAQPPRRPQRSGPPTHPPPHPTPTHHPPPPTALRGRTHTARACSVLQSTPRRWRSSWDQICHTSVSWSLSAGRPATPTPSSAGSAATSVRSRRGILRMRRASRRARGGSRQPPPGARAPRCHPNPRGSSSPMSEHRRGARGRRIRGMRTSPPRHRLPCRLCPRVRSPKSGCPSVGHEFRGRLSRQSD